MNSTEKLEIIDKIINHFNIQNTFSINGIVCMYRNENGNKCALGALITDEEYDIGIEGGGVNTLSEYYPYKFKKEDYEFYMDLQFIHDQHARFTEKNLFSGMMNEYKEYRKKFE